MKYKFPEPSHYDDVKYYQFKLAKAYTDSYMFLVEAIVLISISIDAIKVNETEFAVKIMSEFLNKMKAE